MRKSFLLIVALVVLLSALQLRLKPAVEVSGPVVTLGDVVEECPTDLQSLTLGYSPPYGESRRIDANEVEKALNAWGIYDVKVVGEGVEVRRKGEFYSWGKFADLVKTILSEIYGAAEVSPKKGGVYGPPGAEISFSYDRRAPTDWKEYRLVVRGRNFLRTFPLSSCMDVKVRVWVVKEEVRRGDRFREGDVEAEMVKLQRVPVDVLTSWTGREASVSLAPGTVLTESVVRREVLVRKGGKIRGFVRVGAVVVKIWGTALDEGGEGDVVRMKTEDGRILKGKVVSEGEIEIL